MSDSGGSLKKCYKCGYIFDIGIGDAIPTEMVCDSCGSWVHCCANCRFYDEFAKPPCRETQAEFVSDPRGKNSCDYFQFASDGARRGTVQRKSGGRDEDYERRKRKGGWRSAYGGGRHDDGRGAPDNTRRPMGRSGGRRDNSPRLKLEKLFKNGPPDNTPRPAQADPMDKLRNLFGKNGDDADRKMDDDFGDERERARRKLDRLFNPALAKSASHDRRDPRRKLEDLFKKKKEDEGKPE